mgnify:CR=1 FL=1
MTTSRAAGSQTPRSTQFIQYSTERPQRACHDVGARAHSLCGVTFCMYVTRGRAQLAKRNPKRATPERNVLLNVQVNVSATKPFQTCNDAMIRTAVPTRSLPRRTNQSEVNHRLANQPTK